MAGGQTKFVARFTYAQNDGEVAMAGFADQQYDAKAYVLLQRTLCPNVEMNKSELARMLKLVCGGPVHFNE
jgi:hypothetical protein